MSYVLLTYLNNKNGPLSPKMGRFGAIYKVENNFPDSIGKDHGLQLEPSVDFVLFTWFTYPTSGLEHPIFQKIIQIITKCLQYGYTLQDNEYKYSKTVIGSLHMRCSSKPSNYYISKQQISWIVGQSIHCIHTPCDFCREVIEL